MIQLRELCVNNSSFSRVTAVGISAVSSVDIKEKPSIYAYPAQRAPCLAGPLRSPNELLTDHDTYDDLARFSPFAEGQRCVCLDGPRTFVKSLHSRSLGQSKQGSSNYGANCGLKKGSDDGSLVILSLITR